MYRHLLKPVFDFVIALLLLIVTSPLLVLAILILSIANHGKIWFRQQRPGLNEKVFTLIKFRTMTDERDPHGNLLPDDKRLTPVGKFIRRTSIDELPQLFNVLRGEMSLVGPRPLLLQYLPLYNQYQRMRHTVKPGVTGWAQVRGRNAITWQQKFMYDVWYVNHLSFWLDLKIIVMTIFKVLKSEGISSVNSSTMENFKGN